MISAPVPYPAKQCRFQGARPRGQVAGTRGHHRVHVSDVSACRSHINRAGDRAGFGAGCHIACPGCFGGAAAARRRRCYADRPQRRPVAPPTGSSQCQVKSWVRQWPCDKRSELTPPHAHHDTFYPGYMSRKIRKFQTDKLDTCSKRKCCLMQLM